MASIKRLSKAEKSLFVVCIVALLPLGALVCFDRIRNADPQWETSPKIARPQPNGYNFYLAGAKAVVDFNPPVDAQCDSTHYAPGSSYNLKNYSLKRRLKWSFANHRTFAILAQGLKTPSMICDYGMGSEPKGDWFLLRQLARNLGAQARTFQMQKRPFDATRTALNTLQMGQDTMRGGGLMPRLVAMQIMSIGRTPLDDWNQTINALDANEAKQSARRLETILAHEPSISQTLTVEKAKTLDQLRQLLASNNWRGPVTPQAFFAGRNVGENWIQVWQRQTLSKRTFYSNMERVLNAQIAHSFLPYSQIHNAPIPPDVDIFTRLLDDCSISLIEHEAAHRTSDNMLLLRLALRAYVAEHEQAPPTLALLVPRYLQSIPTDIYNDGKPLFYKPQGKTYKLWSVGPDGVNDDGVPLARRLGEKPLYPVLSRPDAKGDFVAGQCR